MFLRRGLSALCCLVFFTGNLDKTSGYCNDSENIALWKPTRQSSIRHDGFSNRSVDGNKATRYGENSCTHTHGDSNHTAWWQVDLQNEYNIKRVLVTNRASRENRLYNLLIEAGNNDTRNSDGSLVDGDLCHQHLGGNISAGETREFTCNDWTKGRYLSISVIPRSTENILTLCEVEIYGCTIVPSTALCPSCNCLNNTTAIIFDDETLKKVTESLKQELKVARTTTSMHIRKLTSAPDDRMSSQGIGYLGVMVLAVTFGSIVLCDLIKLYRYSMQGKAVQKDATV